MANGITLSTSSNLTSGQKILVKEAKLAFEPAAPSPDLVGEDMLPPGHKTRDLAYYARLAQANALTEGVDLAQVEQLVTVTTSVNPSEHGIIVTFSKKLVRRQADTSVIASGGRMMGGSLRRRQANDVITIYDTLTKSIVGANSPLDITYFRGAVAYLMTDNNSTYGPAPMPYVADFHAEQISDIILDLSDPGTSAGRFAGEYSTEMVQRWWRGNDRLYGIAIFNDGVLAVDGSGDTKGALGNLKESIVVVNEGNDESTEEPDNSLRVVEYGLFKSWGEALIVDPYAVEVYSDITATV